MKIFPILLAVFLASHAQSAELAPKLKQTLLQGLNQICGDSWCAGDFEYKFQDLDCDFESGHCLIDLTVQSRDEVEYNDKGVEIFRKSFSERRYACDLSGFQSEGQLVDSSALPCSNAFYDALSSCIAETIAPVQNAIRFAWPLKQTSKDWNLSRVVDCPNLEESTRPLASEYAFTADDKRDFALIAALDRSGLDAAANPS
ncbi:MAG: hypothetical protein EOP07_18675, partial [Proteobacteria bacterium]